MLYIYNTKNMILLPKQSCSLKHLGRNNQQSWSTNSFFSPEARGAMVVSSSNNQQTKTGLKQQTSDLNPLVIRPALIEHQSIQEITFP
jgi:hypothetical protein